jgi:hypothetical protein
MKSAAEHAARTVPDFPASSRSSSVAGLSTLARDSDPLLGGLPLPLLARHLFIRLKVIIKLL